MTVIRKQYSATLKAQIVQEVLAGEKTLGQIASHYEVHPHLIGKWKQAALAAMPHAFDENESRLHQQIEALKAQHEQEKEALYAEIGRLTTHVNWLQKKLQQELPLAVRRTLVERDSVELSLSMQAQLLTFSRSSLYDHAVQPSAAEILLKHRIDELYTASPFFGSRRLTALLRREGQLVNRKAVQRHMREMGLVAIAPGPNLSRRQQADAISPYLLRGLNIDRPNLVWGVDITYIRMQGGWMYLVAILDWYSRYVVSWELDQTLEQPFVLRAVNHALAQATPTISIVTKAAILPAHSIRVSSKRMRSKSVWMARGELSTIFSPSDCGAR